MPLFRIILAFMNWVVDLSGDIPENNNTTIRDVKNLRKSLDSTTEQLV